MQGNNTNNVIWYENKRSIDEKTTLVELFGIKGFLLWILGNIPELSDTPEAQMGLNIWNEIIKNY